MTKPELFSEASPAQETAQPAEQGQQAVQQAAEVPPWASAMLENFGRLVDDKIKAALPAPAAQAPKPADATAQARIDDAEEAAARRFTFEKAIDGMPQAAQDLLRKMYTAERPADVSAWVNGHLPAFGLGKGQAMNNGTNNGGAPVTNGGVPKIDRSLANYGKTIFDVSPDDAQQSIRDHGLLETGRRFRAQMRKDLPGHILQKP